MSIPVLLTNYLAAKARRDDSMRLMLRAGRTAQKLASRYPAPKSFLLQLAFGGDDMDGCQPIDPAVTEARLKSDFEDWFKRLQALTDEVLVPEDWTEQWFDGYTPEEALEVKPSRVDCRQGRH